MAEQTWTLRSVEEWFRQIKLGNKTIEGRLMMAGLKPGDSIQFVWKDESIFKKVSFVHVYGCFAELLDVEGIDKILPGVQTPIEGVQIFASWYSFELQKNRQVIAIGLTSA